MKFVHTGDIHWGMYPDANKPWDKERTQAIKGTLRIIIEKARGMGVDCLFISGDPFHRQPLMKGLREVNYPFSAIPAVKVTLITDSHDHIREGSALLSFTWSPNVTFIMDEALTSVYLGGINTEVHGFSYHTARVKAPLLGDIQVPLNNRIQILMARGGDTTHLLINFNSLELSPFFYIALGHIHRPHVLADGKIAYYDSPEPLDLTETGSRSFYAGEIHPVTRRLINLRLIPAASLQCIPLAVNMSRDTTNEKLCDCISNGIENRGSQHIYRFRVRDMGNPDTEFDPKQLTVRYGIAEAIDNSEPQYDLSALFAEHPSGTIGFYIQAFQKEDMSPVEKKALCYGVNAFLHTTDERN